MREGKVSSEADTKRRTGLVGLALVTLATDCSLLLNVRQAFEEQPSPDCLASALATAGDVVEVTHRNQERFGVILRDSTVENSRRAAAVWASPPDSPPAITISFFWDRGLPRRRAPAAEERTVTSLGQRLLAHLRTVCALKGPGPVVCDYNSDHPVKSCEALYLTPS